MVPVRNEAATLPALWSSVLEQTRPPDEVVIVDGGSTDGTVEVAHRLAAGDPRLRVVETEPATPGKGRNIGIRAASNEWVALTDAGIRLERRWLESLLAAAVDPAIRVVYGHYEPVVRTFFERCASLAYVAVPRETPAGRIRGPSVASMLLHRSAWEAAGGFPDLRAGEDLIFMSRLEALSVPTAWAPSAVVRWELRPSLGSTFRKFYEYSYSAVLGDRHRDWHHSILRMYLAASPFVVLAVARKRWVWATPALAGGCARVARSIARRREDHGVLWVLNPLQFAGVALIIGTIDVATFLGWARAVVAPGPRATARVPPEETVDRYSGRT